ncbi:MAG: hypothetical protein ACOC2D_02645 [Spirochaetota bacterium]
MIEIGTIGIRHGEAVVLGLLVVSTVLLFLKRRPAGLVWFSAITMTAIAVHLYAEHGRWQMVPAYGLLFVFAFWLARPAGPPYRSAPAYRAGGLMLRIAVAIVVVPALLVPLLVPIFVIPAPAGPHGVGYAQVVAPVLPATEESSDFERANARLEDPLQIDVWYPAEAGAPTLVPFWSVDDLARYRLPGLPRIAATHLTLVPTPVGHRAPVIAGRLPVLVVVQDRGVLPGDYLHLVLEAASAGWLVASLPGGIGEAGLLDAIAALEATDNDQALAGRIDANRLVLLLTGDSHELDLGVPELRIGGELALEASLPSGRYALGVPGAQIPERAYTIRHLLVRPSQLLVGSSDIGPARLDRFLRHAVRTLLRDGGQSAPVFSGTPPDQGSLLGELEGAVFRQLPAAPR